MSLKQQLKKIGTLDLRNVSETTRKYKASFLFTAREAADQDLETIYSIAYNGIMELAILDEKFSAFEATLFSERMKSVDRILQTKEENDKLDSSINSFLCQLSPYFLLKPAGKVLEYLIRRFRIYDFNVESVLKCILPYHETKSFVKMVSILKFEEKSPWGFLMPIKKSMLPLERSLLVKKMMKNRYVFDFICNMAVKPLVPFQTLYSFYAALMTDFIKLAPSVTNDMSIALTPHLIDGFKSKKLPELQLTSYMIVSQLASKAAFNNKAAEEMAKAIIKYSKKAFYSHAVLTIVHICQSQESLDNIPLKATNLIISNPNFEKTILEITEKYATDRFFKIVIPAMTKGTDNTQLLETLSLQSYLSSSNISLLCQSIISSYLALVKSQNSEQERSDYISSYQTLLAIISQRYVDELDSVLAANLSDESVSKSLYEFTSAAFKGTRHQVIEEANTTLYLCLNSPSASNRLIAVKKLVDIIDDKSNPLTQSPEIFESSFLGCLENFGPLLSYAVDDVPHHLLDHVPAEKILSALSDILQEHGAYNSNDSISIIKFLLHDFAKKHPELDESVGRIVSVFMFVAPTANKNALLKKLPKSGTANSKLLKSMVNDLKTSLKEGEKGDYIAFIKLLAKSTGSVSTDLWINMVKSNLAAENSVGLLVLSHAVVLSEGSKQHSLCSAFLDAILYFIGKKNSLFYTSELPSEFRKVENGLPSDQVIDNFRHINKVTTSDIIQLVQFAVLGLTVNTKRTSGAIEWFNVKSSDDKYPQFLIKLFKTLVGGSHLGSFEYAITELIKGHLRDDILCFLTSIWTNNDHGKVVRARALQVTASYLEQYSKSGTAIDFQNLVPALFPTLGDVNNSVRVQGVHCLESIHAMYSSRGFPSGPKVYHADDATENGAKSSGKISIFGASELYGTKVSLPALRTNDMSHLVDFLWYRNNEISKDHTYTIHLFKDYLSSCENAKSKVFKTRMANTLDFLLRHVIASPSVELQINMLSMLDSVDSPLKLATLGPLLESTLNKPRNKETNNLVHYLIRTFLPSNASSLGVKSDTTLPLFLRLLANKDALEGEDDDGWQVSTRRFALQQITSEFFDQATSIAQEKIFSSLIDIATNGIQNDVRASKTVLAQIDIPAKMFEDVLTSAAKALTGVSTTPTTSKAKRVRAAEEPAKPVDLYELVTVLELIESKAISHDENLVKPLFEVFTAMVNADLRDSPVSLEYINQLVMSSLTRIIQSAEERGVHVEESTLRVDIVVQCIRITGNPQTHNQALLLMATIASMYPECVLHNIMPVFTFMGANVLRQDDNYSFQVIQQTLEKILPPLVVSSRKTNNNNAAALVLEVKPIIKVFVDALFHIPKHRRLRLFTVLIHTLGEDEFLYAIVSLLLEKFTERLAKGARSDAESLTEFSLIICQNFGPETQMRAILELLSSLLALPNEKPEDVTMDDTNLFNVNEHSAKQLRQYKLATLNFIGQLLASKGFLGKVMTLTNTTENFQQTMQPLYLQAVELILKNVTYYTEYRDTYSVSKDANPAITKFWRAVLKVVYDVLDKVNSLLPLNAFIQVISELINHDDYAIRRKAMNIFNEKMESFEGAVPEGEEEALVDMVKKFTSVLEKESATLAGEENSIVNKQSALICISSLAKLLGSLYPGQFSDAIPAVTGPDGLGSNNAQLQISSLVSLTVICREIGPRAVPHLPKFMPVVTELLLVTVNAENPNTLLQLGVISALETIINVLPHFISPYLTKILSGLLHSSIYVTDAAHSQKAIIESKTKSVLTELATNVPPRVLLAPVFNFYDNAIKNGKDATLAFFSVVSQAIRTMSRDTMTSHYKQLFKFFLLSFDVRRAQSAVFSESDINEIEDTIISAFLDLVMKLNETLFKPLFLKVVDWATVELAEDGICVSEDGLKRVLFFYKFTDALLEKLKTIFTPYYAYLIDDVIMRLERYKNEEQEIDSLWDYIMSSLRKSFLYDSDNLWNATKFEKILDPVVDQMLITTKGTSVDYLARMNTYVVSCVGQMATTVSNDALWKPLNYKVLMKTREDDPEIRLAALKCIEEFYVRLGEEWLLFLAESISFLAELMEDDDVRVEKLVQQVNAEIESHLGESLDKFFN